MRKKSQRLCESLWRRRFCRYIMLGEIALVHGDVLSTSSYTTNLRRRDDGRSSHTRLIAKHYIFNIAVQIYRLVSSEFMIYNQSHNTKKICWIIKIVSERFIKFLSPTSLYFLSQVFVRFSYISTALICFYFLNLFYALEIMFNHINFFYTLYDNMDFCKTIMQSEYHQC